MSNLGASRRAKSQIPLIRFLKVRTDRPIQVMCKGGQSSASIRTLKYPAYGTVGTIKDHFYVAHLHTCPTPKCLLTKAGNPRKSPYQAFIAVDPAVRYVDRKGVLSAWKKASSEQQEQWMEEFGLEGPGKENTPKECPSADESDTCSDNDDGDTSAKRTCIEVSTGMCPEHLNHCVRLRILLTLAIYSKYSIAFRSNRGHLLCGCVLLRYIAVSDLGSGLKTAYG
jgi:hypothetical protein